MPLPFIDTDVLIRLLTGDDPVKQAAAAALFERVEQGQLTLAAPATVIADAVFVLASPRLYHLPRKEIAELLIPLVQLPGFHVRSRRTVLAALSLYATTAFLDFGDALIIATMQAEDAHLVYSYDTHFDRMPGITRQAP